MDELGRTFEAVVLVRADGQQDRIGAPVRRVEALQARGVDVVICDGRPGSLREISARLAARGIGDGLLLVAGEGMSALEEGPQLTVLAGVSESTVVCRLLDEQLRRRARNRMPGAPCKGRRPGSCASAT